MVEYKMRRGGRDYDDDDGEEQLRPRPPDQLTRPGAPQSDLTKNKPMTPTGGYELTQRDMPTSNSVWANIFKQNTGLETQRAALSERLATLNTATPDPNPARNISQQVLDEIMPRTPAPMLASNIASNPFSAPFSSLELQPLSVLAAGGLNHQQKWSAGAETKDDPRKKFGWASSFF